MSDARHTEDLLQRIVGDGRPRRLVPRARVMLALFAGLSAVVASLYLRFGVGLRPDFALRLSGDIHFAAVWLGLAVLSSGATLWVVAESIPGRVALQRGGRALTFSGALLGFVVAPVAILIQSGGGGLHADTHELMCMRGAFRIGALPYAALLGWVFWAAPANPLRTALCGAIGAGGIGALLIHATCPDTDPAHWMVGHAFAPLLAAALAALPLWVLVHWQRVRRRRPL